MGSLTSWETENKSEKKETNKRTVLTRVIQLDMWLNFKKGT